MKCAFHTKSGGRCRNDAAHLVGQNADIPICAMHWRIMVIDRGKDARSLRPRKEVIE